MEKKSLFLYIVILTILMTGFTGCKKKDRVRKYTETKPQFVWDIPTGWKEEPSTSRLRMATFSISRQNMKSLCTIIPLQGEAGGLKANTSRWLTQIFPLARDIPVKTDLLLRKQQKYKTRGDFAAVFMDFTLLTEKPADISPLVTVIKVKGNSVFIKMKGPKSHLLENREKFKTLSLSFRLGNN